MKIIAHTERGYLIEANPEEIHAITGNHAANYGLSKIQTLPVGTAIEVVQAFKHIERVTRHEEDRRRIAEQLRAAASVLETTPILIQEPNLTES